ncbi:DUF3127 domain-containing protein [Flagellimonas sp.]|uniref:DUF3127 domain-containing protein n=1 Tax=Flagellimonas sp. TaxID=2058762 RepID=UPI003BA892A6
MNQTITGIIKTISDKEKFESGLEKRFVTVKTVGEYPDIYDIDFLNDNMEKLKGFKPGQLVSVKCRMQGREVTSKEDNSKTYRIVSFNGYQISNYE